MKFNSTIMTACLFAGIAASVAQAAPTLTFIAGPDGNPLGTQVNCISGDAQSLAGTYANAAFTWTFGGGSTAMTAPGSSIRISSTNETGTIVVGGTELSGKRLPLRWVNRVAEVLQTNALEGFARGISSDGHRIVGYVGPESGLKRAVSWDDAGAITFLDSGQTWTTSSANDASADGTVIVGSFESVGTPNSRHVALFTAAGVQDIGVPMDYSSYPPRPYDFNGNVDALFITDNGQKVIAQMQQPSTGWFKIFQWTAADDWSQIPMPAGESSLMFHGMNADGSTLIGMVQQHQYFFGYAWGQTTGWFNLRQYLIDNGLPALNEPVIPTGLSSDGLSICGHTIEQGFLISMSGLPCRADFNHDDVVNFFDYLDFVSAFVAELPSANFNRDAVIDFFDYLDYVDAFSTGC